MKTRLFIIGNGFDLSHGLPTGFNPHFKEISESIEQNSFFWEFYQTHVTDIWSDFENLLGKPDFNELESIFEGYTPDYFSDRESDRDAIITQVSLNGNLVESLEIFANQAEKQIEKIKPQKVLEELFNDTDLFVSFNYTHTLEKLYGIERSRVLHIHGEVGDSELIFGYPEGKFSPEKYIYDVRQKGRGPNVEIDYLTFIEEQAKEQIIDSYTYTAYSTFYEKIESFQKNYQVKYMEDFLSDFEIKEIIVKGHSCGIDFPYFEYLKTTYPISKWFFYSFDKETTNRIRNLVKMVKIYDYTILDERTGTVIQSFPEYID